MTSQPRHRRAPRARSRPRPVRLAAPALILVGALVLAACSDSSDSAADATPDATSPAAADGTVPGAPTPTGPVDVPPDDPSLDPALATFYDQRLDWGDCTDLPVGTGTPVDGLECATLQVPLDWADPGAGDVIDIPVVNRPAWGDGEPVGRLVLNPGGPGGSGVDQAIYAEESLPDGVREAHDVIGFDPRGVARSHALLCLDRETFEAYDPFVTLDLSPDDDAERAALADFAREFAAGCADNPLAAHVDAVSVARDMDVLRAALGDERLDFYGYSYGTVLGAVYADLLPHRVGAMVLDSAVDVATWSGTETAVESAEAAEASLEAFVDDCLTQADCPLEGDDVAAMAQITGFVAGLEADPLIVGADDTPVTDTMVVNLIAALTASEDTWPFMRSTLAQMFDRNGTLLNDVFALPTQEELDFLADPSRDSLQALFAVQCLEHGSAATVPDAATVEDMRTAVAAASPLLGPVYAEILAWCADWPVERVTLPEIDAPGAAPIVVIGVTGDATTPYEWSQRSAEALESGVLVTFEEGRHGAGGTRGAECIDAMVTAYLVDGEVPEDGLVCGASV